MKTIPLANSGNTIVDDEDYEKYKNWGWIEDYDGYAINHNRKTRNYLHRLILEDKLNRKVLPYPKEICDHIDGNKLNNQRENLKLSNHSKNLVNSNKARYTPNIGIRFHSKSYEARITRNKRVYEKCFKTEIEAINWRNEKIKELDK